MLKFEAFPEQNITEEWNKETLVLLLYFRN